ncbi:cysteine--tRNA ligase, partial [Candidatus Giovannonibacteria bacterium]|nr:cysteine--tRNA ligase [Candidatus Giovannonibacteria bacterium]
MALVWQVIKDNKLAPKAKKRLLGGFDNVLGLGLNKIKPFKIPQKIKDLATGREKFRTNKQFVQADA